MGKGGLFRAPFPTRYKRQSEWGFVFFYFRWVRVPAFRDSVSGAYYAALREASNRCTRSQRKSPIGGEKGIEAGNNLGLVAARTAPCYPVDEPPARRLMGHSVERRQVVGEIYLSERGPLGARWIPRTGT